MSFINEALKKAQKDRDSLRIRYSGVMAVCGHNRNPYAIRLFALFVFLVICAALIFRLYPDSFTENNMMPEQAEYIVRGSADPAVLKGASQETGLLYEKAVEQYKERNFKEAERLYQKVLDLDPGYIKALNNIGVIHIQNSEYRSAQDNFKKAIRLNPYYVDPYYNMACLYSLTGEPDQAIFYLKKAIAINPEVREWAEKDSDMTALRGSEKFQEIIDRT